MSADDPSRNPFIRFKNHVDDNIRKGVDSILPARRSPNEQPNGGNTATANHRDHQSAETKMDPPRRPGPPQNTDEAADAVTRFENISTWLVRSPYSPLNLDHLHPPVPRGPSGEALPDVGGGFRSAFEDLLAVSWGHPLPSELDHALERPLGSFVRAMEARPCDRRLAAKWYPAYVSQKGHGPRGWQLWQAYFPQLRDPHRDVLPQTPASPPPAAAPAPSSSAVDLARQLEALLGRDGVDTMAQMAGLLAMAFRTAERDDDDDDDDADRRHHDDRRAPPPDHNSSTTTTNDSTRGTSEWDELKRQLFGSSEADSDSSSRHHRGPPSPPSPREDTTRLDDELRDLQRQWQANLLDLLGLGDGDKPQNNHNADADVEEDLFVAPRRRNNNNTTKTNTTTSDGEDGDEQRSETETRLPGGGLRRCTVTRQTSPDGRREQRRVVTQEFDADGNLVSSSEQSNSVRKWSWSGSWSLGSKGDEAQDDGWAIPRRFPESSRGKDGESDATSRKQDGWSSWFWTK
ncbi:hypothetical protein F4780DRAFT_100016 [Xylariomycetidae sp. FL0641]|nr:hypothetical protein F4780DRAFT_100016 [Xylariomycetidae sp. FL0641]